MYKPKSCLQTLVTLIFVGAKLLIFLEFCKSWHVKLINNSKKNEGFQRGIISQKKTGKKAHLTI